jgi:hypothetical protein
MQKDVFYIGRLNTQRSNPDSPAISKRNVGDAETIITITMDHHWLGVGPQTDRVFAYRQGDI